MVDEFEDKIKIFSSKIDEKLKHISTEETTKTALILPFLQVMGYDTTNPMEVKMEYAADMGAKKGEKIDIAILNDFHEIILIECKIANLPLDQNHISQLYRYFNITDSEIGILTNGVTYQFFTDSIKKGQMDKTPFLEIDLNDLSKKEINELNKFTKDNFDITKIKSKVDDLKFAHDINKIISLEFDSPTDEFVKAITKQAYPGVFTSNVKNKFRKIIKQEIDNVINDKVEAKLNNALEKTNNNNEYTVTDEDSEIVTTEDEYEGYFIVKSILSKEISPNRIFIRDFKSYCTVLLDDNKYYPLIRLYFNNPNNLRVGIFEKFEKNNSGKKVFTNYNINSVDEIYDYDEKIVKTLNIYLREIKNKK